MKFRDDRPFASVDAAVKKLLEIANGLEADHAGRIHIGRINAQFMSAGGDIAEYSAAVKAAIERGILNRSPPRPFSPRIFVTPAASPISAVPDSTN